MTFKKILRRVGQSGEHYLARTSKEAFHVFGAGGGAGLLTAATVIFKFMIVWLKLSYIAEAALFGVNYASSFLLMQGLGFRLATKQPSLLALTLLNKRRIRPVRSQLLAMARSQCAATFGNFSLVLVSALFFHFVYLDLTGHPFLSSASAVHTLDTLDPFRADTLPFAALTGALLWLASLASGSAAHFACQVKNRKPRPLRKHAAGVGFNVALAFLLCSTPLLGKTLHLPLDVRHFTLSSGALALSACSLGLSASWHAGLAPACLGIVLIGVLNFGVSFALSLATALVANGVSWRKLCLIQPQTLQSGLLATASKPMA